ncbi:aspartyl-tRNA(Asn)/glutamyl-tRNA(Gln) amidotransferase subunit A [Bosea sp. OAE506]
MPATGTTKPLHELSIAEAGAALRAGELTATALAQDALARIAALDGALNSFITVTAERALADADAADAAFKAGIDAGPMQGVPYALKDIYDTAGIRTTCHSKLLVDNVPAADSVVAAKIKAGGGVLLGKLSTHEFALGGPSFDLPFPPARNPWNPEHIPGGSSSGSGAAEAAGLCRMAMGSDTGGSIRGPAAYCGTVGLKPTYGLVSRRGVFPLSYTLDHCGPLSWTVEDAAITMEVITGHDPLDPASADVPAPDFRSGLGGDVSGLKIALPRHFFAQAEGVSPEVLAAIDKAADLLAKAGAIVEEVTIPDYELFNAVGRVIMFSEAFAIHEKDYRERPLDFGRLTFTRMILGATTSAADLTQAYRLRPGAGGGGQPPAAQAVRRDPLRLGAGAGRALRQLLGRLPAKLADPDHAVQRHRQPGDVDAGRVLGLGPAAFGADRRAALRRADGSAHRGADREGAGPDGAAAGDSRAQAGGMRRRCAEGHTRCPHERG